MLPRLLGVVLLLGLAPLPLLAQLPIPPVAIEGRLGYAIPLGDLASTGGAAAEAGPAFSVGGRIDATPVVSIVGAYNQTRFECPTCADRDLDSQMILKGAEAGVRVATRRPFAGFTPWVQGGLLYQTLAFSSAGDRMTSSSALGFSAAAGATLRFARHFELMPGVRYLMVPASFSFSFAPDMAVDVSGIVLDIGLALRP